MSSITHEPPSATPARRHWSARMTREAWASLAISVMWLAVLFAAAFAPDFVSTDAGGGSTTVPSGVFVALFAAIGTSGVAKYGLGRRDGDGDGDGD